MKKPDIYIVGININKQYAYSLSKEADPADRYVRVVHGIYFRASIPAEQLFETYGFRITRQLLANAALTHSTAWYKRPTDGRIFVGGAYPYHRTVGDKVGDFAIVQSMISQRSNQLLTDMLNDRRLYYPFTVTDPMGSFDMHCATDEMILLSMFDSTKANKEKHLPQVEMNKLLDDLLYKYGDMPTLLVLLREMAEEIGKVNEYNRALKSLLTIK